MSFAYILQTLGIIPLFSSRAFLASFASVAVAKYGDQVPLLKSFQGIRTLQNAPEWFTSDWMFWGLAVMAALEFLATKNQEAREIFEQADSYLKTGLSLLVCAAILDKDTAAMIAPIQSGFSLGYIWSMFVGYAVWTISAMRAKVMEFMRDIDDDDDFGVQGLMAWAEDGYVVLGFLFLIVLPILAVLVFAATVFGLFLAHRWVIRFERKSFVPCAECDAEIHPSAIQCASCKKSVEQPKQIGALGQARSESVTDLETHRLKLLSKKRCPNCALRLPERSPCQECPNCATVTFADQQALDDYMGAVEQKLKPTLVTCGLLSMVPLLGLIPGIIFYRLTLVASIRAYLPRIRNFLTRWLVRLINLLLICLQLIPVLGAAVLPLMCLTNYSIYRKALKKEGAKAFASAEEEG